jgi:hypothetical protein
VRHETTVLEERSDTTRRIFGSIMRRWLVCNTTTLKVENGVQGYILD